MMRTRTAATAITAATLTLSLTSLAAAATSSAPVVHERFTLLPCPGKPSTTVQIEGCAEHKVLTEDRTIDGLNAKIYAKLNRSARAAFVQSSRDWVSYRDESCTAESSISEGGTIQPVAYANCLVSIDSSHVGELKSMLLALSPAG